MALGGALLFLVLAVGPTAGAATGAAEGSKRVDTLTAPKAVVLGLVEGVTEYLPISSTGHLLIAEKILGVGQSPQDRAATDTFTIVIQIGAILAVLGIFWKRFMMMFDGVTGRSPEGRSLVISLLVAFVPAAIIGKVLGSPIKDHLLRPWPVVGAWVVGAVVIFVFVANQSRLRVRVTSVGAIAWRTALLIGVAQVAALWPGTSRSLVTILAALILGLSMQTAVEFSFLLGFITLSAATGLELVQNGKAMFDAFGYVNPAIGIVVAGISAFASVKWMITYLEKHPLTIFGWYRLGAAGLTAVLLVTKVI